MNIGEFNPYLPQHSMSNYSFPRNENSEFPYPVTPDSPDKSLKENNFMASNSLERELPIVEVATKPIRIHGALSSVENDGGEHLLQRRRVHARMFNTPPEENSLNDENSRFTLAEGSLLSNGCPVPGLVRKRVALPKIPSFTKELQEVERTADGKPQIVSPKCKGVAVPVKKREAKSPPPVTIDYTRVTPVRGFVVTPKTPVDERKEGEIVRQDNGALFVNLTIDDFLGN